MEERHRLPGRERERRRKRLAILDVAKAVFAERSYAEATIEEIAERAEFGKGTTYLYFKEGKREILEALPEGLFNEVRPHLENLVESGASSNGSTRDLLGEYVRWLVCYLIEQRDLFIVSIKETDLHYPQDNKSDTALWGQRHGDFTRLMAALFDTAVRRGELRPVDSLALANTFFFAV